MSQSRFLSGGKMSRVWGIFVGMLVLSGFRVFAQTEVENFKVPDIDENGVMVSMMTGKSALMYPDKPMEITHVKVEFFEPDGKTVKLKVVSPFCYYDTRKNTATSDARVRIEGTQFLITGEGYIFEPAHSRVEIQKDVKVLLRNLDIKTSKSKKE